jgi:hypothetical protein
MAKGQAKTERLQVMIAVRTHAYLELLAEKGTHGVSVTDVAKGLIERGIQIAVQEGVLTQEEMRGVQFEK